MKFIVYTVDLDFKIGGSVVLHKLAQDLIGLGKEVKLFTASGRCYENIFCSQFASLEDVNEETIVIYPEVIQGNPLNAKHVVRWMLCDLGVHTTKDICNTWNKEDLVFHFSTYNHTIDPQAIEVLFTTWLNPQIKNKGMQRSGSCYLFKKGVKFHKELQMIHPIDALLIDHLTLEEIVEIFNQKEFFYVYDPYSFYDIIALLCGCIPVIYPISGVNKEAWLKTRASFQVHVLKQKNVSGIAYGKEEIPYAKETLHLVEEEQRISQNFEKETVFNFIEKCQKYFFEKQDVDSFKTVRKAIDVFKWNELLGKEEVENHIYYKEKELKELRALNRTLETEVDFMRSSKFWKLRNFVKRLIPI